MVQTIDDVSSSPPGWLGGSRWRLLCGLLLAWARALGEFGATVTLAGNIPGRTQTLASAIFSAQQVGDHGRADLLMVIALGLGLAAILTAELLADRRPEVYEGLGRG